MIWAEMDESIANGNITSNNGSDNGIVLMA